MHRAAGRSWWVAFEGARLSLTFKKKKWWWPRDESRLRSGLVQGKFQIARVG